MRPKVSAEALMLLHMASQVQQVIRVVTERGECVQVGEYLYDSPSDRQRYLGALNELLAAGLIDAVTPTKYELTPAGRDTAKTLVPRRLRGDPPPQ